MSKNNSKWIAGIARGHNSGVCLLKDGEVVFSIEEERLSRSKYDGGPLASIVKILDYTDKLDYLVVAHTQPLTESAGRLEFSGDDVYTGMCRKLGLIDRHSRGKHPQVIDVAMEHHKLHAGCAFYRSGFTEAVAVVIDGAGTFIPMEINRESTYGFETETVFNCNYPADFGVVYKHLGTRGPNTTSFLTEKNADGTEYEIAISDRAGITKVYEAVTQYCGFSAIEAGKTMGLFPYGKENKKIPALFDDLGKIPLSNRNLIVPTYPNAALVNDGLYEELTPDGVDNGKADDYDRVDLTLMPNRRDMAYACQIQTQQQASDLIRKAVTQTGKKKVVLSGGYGLNCVANYHYLKDLEDLDIELYVEPVSNDAGTAMGAALIMYHELTQSTEVSGRKGDNLYLGPKYDFTLQQLRSIAKTYEADVTENATHEDVVKLITEKNIVAIFQGQSENGPRALGNRSLLYDPTDPKGKDHVNEVKRREYFRPFAGTILEEDVHEWFDLRGMKSSPTMMYAVNCKPGVEEKIPAIIHVDGTCRIQTVSEEQNKHYYDLIKEFKKQTGCSIIFNTSFNLGGEPLVETLDDALRTLKESKIEYLYLPEYKHLFKIENE